MRLATEDALTDDASTGGAENPLDNKDVSELVQSAQSEAQEAEGEINKRELLTSFADFEKTGEESDTAQDKVEQLFDALEALGNLSQTFDRYYPANQTQAFKRTTILALESIGAQAELYLTEDIPALESEVEDDLLFGKVVGKMIWKMAKRIWRALIELLKRIYLGVKEFIRKVIAESAILRRRTKNLLEEARATRGVKTEMFLDLPTVAKAINKSNYSASLVSETLSLKYISDGVYIEMSNWSSYLGEQIADYLNTTNLTDTEVPPAIPAVKIPYGDVVTVHDPREYGLDDVRFTALVRTEELLGRAYILTRLPNDNSYLNSLETVSEVYAGIGSFFYQEDSNQISIESQLPVLSLTDCVRLCENIDDTLEYIDNYKRNAGKNENINRRILQGVERIDRELPNLTEGEHKNGVEFIRRCAIASPRIVEEPALHFSNYYLKLSRALLDYVEQSLKTYTK